jgi:MFS superfamily sulfate permease-like transporter
MINIAEKVSYITSACTVAVSALTLQEWGIIIGITMSVLTYITHLVLSIRKDRREQAEHDARLHLQQSRL